MASQVATQVGKQQIIAALQAKTLYLGWGTGTTAAAATDTALQTELTTGTLPGYARQAATNVLATVNFTDDTVKCTATLSGAALGGGTLAITEVGLFDSLTGGNMYAHAVFAVKTLDSSSTETDTIAYTET